MTKAIILAGGKGTRLWPITNGGQKVIVNIAGKSFLEFIIEKLIQENFTKVYLAIGYKSDDVTKLIMNLNLDIDIELIVESKALGTGGAIKNVLSKLPVGDYVIINGDSYNEINYTKFFKRHEFLKADVSILTKYVKNISRYGTLKLDNDNRVERFLEKTGRDVPGIINAGVYVVKSNIFDNIQKEIFSFEIFLADIVLKHKIISIPSNSYFIDIGTPEDFSIFKKLKE